MSISRWLLIGFACAFASVACGGADVTEKAARLSDRYYEAGFVSWFEQKDNLLAIRNLVRAIDANPANHHAHYLLGMIRMGRGEFEEAETHLKEALRLREEGPPAELAEVRNALGVVYIHLERYPEAIALLESASKEVLNREPWLAMGNLGWAYIELGEYDKAVEVLARAMFDQPRFCVGLLRLGQAYYLKGEYEAAQPILEKAVAIPEPGCDQMQQAYYLLGMARLRQRDDRGAREALAACVGLGPGLEFDAVCKEALEGLNP